MERFFNRSAFIITVVWIFVGYAIFTTYTSSQRLVDNAASVQMEADRQIWDVVHELSDDSTAHAVIDYTFWDDIVEFAEGRLDEEWARSNLDPGIASFGIDAIWVLAPDGSLRYSVMSQGDELVAAPTLPFGGKAEIDTLLSKPDEDYGYIHEFYWFSPAGPMSVFGSDITVTDDPEHNLPGRGYYFVGVRTSNDSGLKALNHIGATAEAVRLTTLPPEERPTTSGPHVFYHPMINHVGATIGAIRIEKQSEAFEIFAGNSGRDRNLRIALWLLIGIATTGLAVSLSRTRHRAAVMAEEMTNKLQDANTLLEQRVAERTAELKIGIAQREAAEATLLKRTAELERMNKVMMDRETRIVELKHQLTEPQPNKPDGK